MSIEERLKQALASTVGMPLSGIARSLNIVMFQIGHLHERPGLKGRTRLVGQYALHLMCAWRILQGDQPLVGSQELRVPRNDVWDGFDWSEPASSLADALLERLLDHWLLNPTLVIDAGISRSGDLWFQCEREYRIEIFADSATDLEVWRLMDMNTGQHIVRTGLGYQ